MKQEIELVTRNIIVATQVRNAIQNILENKLVELVDRDDINFHIGIHQFTHYLIDSEYFVNFTSVDELNDFVQKPQRYANEINLAIVYEKVLELANLNLDSSWNDKEPIHYLFSDLNFKQININYAVEYLDDEYLNDLIEYVDDIS